MTPSDVESLEIDLLLEAILRRYGYDLRHYARASLKRRILHRVASAGLERPSDLIAPILRDEKAFSEFLDDVPVTVTEMFRDPSFFAAIRERVVPLLRTYPYFNVWHAGCATGEEAYSMAILLEEEGLYERARIYATDLDVRALERARDAIYPLRDVREHTRNYQAAGGRRAFSDYYQAGYGAVKLDSRLARHITFARHNLVTDGVFAEIQLVICRNVLIYFDRTLQARVVSLFHESLCAGGFLGLGSKESIRFTPAAQRFEGVCERERLFRKRRGVS